MNKYIRKDLDNFDYNKTYNLKSEHIWDFMKDGEKAKKYYDEQHKICYPNISEVQSNPEITGQKGTMI